MITSYTHLTSIQEAQQLCKRLGDSQAMAKTLVLLAEVALGSGDGNISSGKIPLFD